MFENSGMPPLEFIREVLIQYHHNRMTIKQISDEYDVPMALVVRIVEMYELSEDQRDIKRLPGVKYTELEDEARLSKEKITDDDLDDLRIDLGLFEKGHGQDDETEEKK